MINSTKLLSQLVSKTDYIPKTTKVIEHITVSAVLCGAIYYTINVAGWVTQLLVISLIVPILMFRNFGLMHDCVHSSALKNRFWNNFVGELSGTLCLLPYYQWKNIHIQHHYWAGNVDKDPSMRLIKDFSTRSKTQIRILQIAWQKWLPIMAFLQHVVFWSAAIKQTQNENGFRRKIRCLLSYIIPALIYTAIVCALRFKLLLFLPGFLIYLTMVEVINFPHHLSLPQFRGEKVIPVFHQYAVSRSCKYPRIFARFVLNNFNYHTEHHLFPKLPWYALDKLAPQIQLILGSGYNESQGSAWIIKNRKLSLEGVLIYENAQIKSIA